MLIGWIIFVIFLSVFTQSAIGFGLALIAMPLLSPLLDFRLVSPLIALVGIVTKILLLFRYREEVNFNEIWKLAIPSLIFVPLGVWSLDYFNKEIILFLLGIIIVGYALYNLFDYASPDFKHRLWPYLFGSIAGFLGGALNTGGPPIVIYANAQNWAPAKFKSNLQGYALITGVFIIFNHWIKGNLTTITFQYFLYSIPVTIVAVFCGAYVDRYIKDARFQKIVLIALLIIGLQLLF